MRVFFTVLSALRLTLAPISWRFQRSLRDPEKAQRRLLAKISKKLAKTEYGKHWNIETIEDFFKLPIVDYDDLKPWIDKQKSKEGRALVSDRVLFYEKSSGSSGPAKYIPYTAALRGSFSKMFALWAHDLLSHGPRFCGGKLYFSVSPCFDPPETTETGVTVGVEDDTDYLDGWLKGLFNRYFLSSAELSKITDPEEFKLKLCAKLISEPGLEVISVWNPSFLTIILESAEHSKDALIPLISPDRRELVRQSPIPWKQIWPQLKLISCWDSAHALEAANKLKGQFPNVFIQGKGLLATEAPITIPLLAAGLASYVPMIDEVFFEFEDEDGQITGIAGVKEGQNYSLIISQKAGFNRYRLGDKIKIRGRHHGCPCFQFLGRGSSVVDLVGEKLNEQFVADRLTRPLLEESSFKTLIPEPKSRNYCLMIDVHCRDEDSIAKEFEELLMESFHYRHARKLGQLGPCRVVKRPQAAEEVAKAWMDSGRKWGDLKNRALQTVDFALLFALPLKHHPK
jgi:hypothetical protein